ncbi:hypothetical protein PQX77_005389 [Marasmius sp. AFHP31]|nr:hypothetical protein PQX77_005389 [Marasmius sp. AFHP31]
MSSAKPPVRERSRSSGKSTSSRTQPSRRPIPSESQSPPENLDSPAGPELKEIAGKSTDPDGHQGDSGTAKQVGDPELGTKSMHDAEVQDKDTALDPTSAKEGALPDHVADRGEGEDRLNTGSRAEETPQDNAKTDKLAGNDIEDATEGAPNPPKPTLEKSWEVIMKEVTSLDDGLVGGWKEDIDTLLVFAGLFSAVVTAFTIESYQWLREAPEDTTVALLKQISQQMNGTSVPELDTFAVSSSDVAINVLWFLSLIIALVDALFALLCKQWLREHRRHTHTRTPSEALALRWLRHQSLEKWRVPAILASLPMLLELALFLFLAGLLELLRMRHPVPFSIATAVVAFASVFYFGTTIIPAIDIIRQVRQVTEEFRDKRYPFKDSLPSSFIMILPPMEYICPYKSPQAWVAFRSLRLLLRLLFRFPGHLRRVASFLWRRDYITWSTYNRLMNLIGRFIPTLAFGQTISNWSSVDLELLRRADVKLAPPFYELNAFRWLVAELRDSPHMIPHLRKVLSTIPLHLVMPTVLDQWFFLPGRKWTVGDIETALGPNLDWRGIEDHLTVAKKQSLAQGRETRLFNHFLHWIHVSMNGGDERTDSGRDSLDPFPIPFRSVDAMPDDGLRGGLWDIYMKIAQDPAVPDYFLESLMQDLALYIIASSPDYVLHLPTATTTSPFVGSADGCEFLSKIHSTICERKLFRYLFSQDRGMDWMEAVDILRCVHNLPETHFKPIPSHFPLPLTKLKKTLNSLSPIDLDNDFQYLDKLSRGWGDANEWNKAELVKILSEHINSYPEFDAEPSHGPGKPMISPMVMSSAGLELMTFVNNHLAEEFLTWWHVKYQGQTGDWRNAIERVRAARPELPPDHFKNIFHENADDPPAGIRPSQREVEVEAPAGDSGGSPRDITNEANHDEVNVRHPNSAAELSPKLKPGELDERRPDPLDDGDTNKRESISKQPKVTGDLATGSGDTSSAVQGEEMVGGPDADKNV